jgi:uncharacterized membrane protein
MVAFNAWDLSLTGGMCVLAAAMLFLCILSSFPKALRDERIKRYKNVDSYISSRIFVSASFGGALVSMLYSAVLATSFPDWVAVMPFAMIIACVIYLVPVVADIVTLMSKVEGETE